MENLRVGDPMDKCVDMGAIVNPSQLERIKYYVDLARTEGATVFQSPGPLPSKGYFYPPTLIYGLETSSKCVIDEVPSSLPLPFFTPLPLFPPSFLHFPSPHTIPFFLLCSFYPTVTLSFLSNVQQNNFYLLLPFPCYSLYHLTPTVSFPLLFSLLSYSFPFPSPSYSLCHVTPSPSLPLLFLLPCYSFPFPSPSFPLVLYSHPSHKEYIYVFYFLYASKNINRF